MAKKKTTKPKKEVITEPETLTEETTLPAEVEPKKEVITEEEKENFLEKLREAACKAIYEKNTNEIEEIKKGLAEAAEKGRVHFKCKTTMEIGNFFKYKYGITYNNNMFFF